MPLIKHTVLVQLTCPESKTSMDRYEFQGLFSPCHQAYIQFRSQHKDLISVWLHTTDNLTKTSKLSQVISDCFAGIKGCMEPAFCKALAYYTFSSTKGGRHRHNISRPTDPESEQQIKTSNRILRGALMQQSHNGPCCLMCLRCDPSPLGSMY